MTLSGRVFKFTVCSVMSGRASGFYETKDADEESILDAAVAGKRGVSLMSESDAVMAKKKASQIQQSSNFNGSSPRVVQIPLLPQLAVEAADGVASTGIRADGSQKPREELPPAPAPSIGSLLKIERINPPKPFANSEAKIKRSADRGDKAKIRLIRKHV